MFAPANTTVAGTVLIVTIFPDGIELKFSPVTIMTESFAVRVGAKEVTHRGPAGPAG
jgi:hypothetical protein